MTAKRKARSTAATVERAEQEFADSISLSQHSNTIAAKCQGRLVSAYLGIGAENAVPGRDLVQLLGLKGLRSLTQLIERERRAGAPICASVSGESRGYYMASDPLELEQYVKALDRRLHAVGETRRRLGDVLARLTGQEQIGGWQT